MILLLNVNLASDQEKANTGVHCYRKQHMMPSTGPAVVTIIVLETSDNVTSSMSDHLNNTKFHLLLL